MTSIPKPKAMTPAKVNRRLRRLRVLRDQLKDARAAIMRDDEEDYIKITRVIGRKVNSANWIKKV